MTSHLIKPCYSHLITIHNPFHTHKGYDFSGIEFEVIYISSQMKTDDETDKVLELVNSEVRG